jgi:transposase
MGYRMLKIDHLYEVYRRVVAGESKSAIALQTGWDRKTIGKYIKVLTERSLLPCDKTLPRDEFYERAGDLADQPREKSTPARDQLIDHLDELRDLIAPSKNENGRSEKPMRPKSAYRVIVRRHGLSIGYSSFKRFARDHGLMIAARKLYTRIELPPGREIQLDYGKMGVMSVNGQNRTIWAFCGILTHSRKPFVQLVVSQNEQSFAESVVEMFHFYGGVTEFITVDNLKAAVIKPDLWDPQLNRSLAEVAEYYQTFVNTARVETATDKAKVERIVPVVRETFRVIREVHPTATLKEMNQYMIQWCVDEYGSTPHGTTHIPPEEAFVAEQNALKPLPEARFEPATWKYPKVHSGDGFLSYNKMRFAVPAKYRGKTVAVRATSRLVEIFYGTERIRAYPYEPGTRVYYFKSDFPAEKLAMMDGSYPQHLVQRANSYGSAARDLISAILAPHAYLNARQAQGLLRVMDEFLDHPDFDAHCLTALRRRIVVPKTFKALFETDKTDDGRKTLPAKPATDLSMARDINYFFNSGEDCDAASS